MRLFIAEKKELALAIVAGLGGGDQQGCVYHCGPTDRVVACRGHMLELMEPHDYDPELEKWTMQTLPWAPVPWRKKPVQDTAPMLKTILGLIKEADEIVHAGDPDDEGQLIVDEILAYAKWTGPVKRVLIRDLNVKAVQRAFERMEDNRKFTVLSESAEARSVGDILYGVNITRAYTLMAQSKGYSGVLHVGRVQTAILGMVERRCRENAHHQAAFYYLVNGQFTFGDVAFEARYVTTDTDLTDEKGRLTDKAGAAAIAKEIANKAAIVKEIKTEAKEQPPKLPYNLLTLQADASRLFGFMPDKTLKIADSLRITHKLITYARSDNRYLNDEQHEEAPGILAAIAVTCPAFAPLVKRADSALRGRVFNSSKAGAHHGIIPTEAEGDFAKLSEEEQKIYMLIARAYVAQFWPNCFYDLTKITIAIGEREFKVTSKVITSEGWRKLYQGQKDEDEEEDTCSADLRSLKSKQEGLCKAGAVDEKKTKPQPFYTMATLLTDLTRVAKYVRDPKLRKVLIEKDKGKEDENGGIGTPATRDSIIKNLFERGYFEWQGKNIVTTKQAHDFYDVLPDTARYPDMTAIWQEQQFAIQRGDKTKFDVVNSIIEWIGREVERVATEGLNIRVHTLPCPLCSKPMRRVKGEHGFFWACVDREVCKNIMRDVNGRPQARPKGTLSSEHHCTQCSKPLIHRDPGPQIKGQKPRKPYWDCSGFPTCKARYPDDNGKPDLAKIRLPKATDTDEEAA